MSTATAPIYPQDIPLFPLSGALLLPRGELPLHVFEPRYTAMVDDALRGDRIIGIIQPKVVAAGAETAPDHAPLFRVGCAGRITSFNETDDGRYFVTLTGLSRFALAAELPLQNGYRRAVVDWTDFQTDREQTACLDIDRAHLRGLLEAYFHQHDIACDWRHIDAAGDEKLVNCLSMICPFDAAEKQALLEAACCRARARKFMAMLEMAVKAGGCCGGHCH